MKNEEKRAKDSDQVSLGPRILGIIFQKCVFEYFFYFCKRINQSKNVLNLEKLLVRNGKKQMLL